MLRLMISSRCGSLKTRRVNHYVSIFLTSRLKSRGFLLSTFILWYCKFLEVAMFKIKTEVKQSGIHGLGVFTLEKIEKGAIIWGFDSCLDQIMTKETYSKLNKLEKEFVDHYGYFSTVSKSYILCLDSAKYMNHSSTPNTTSHYISNSQGDDLEGFDIATRDIEVGEELTCDYATFDLHFKARPEIRY